jgi:predicted nucleotidyltransferase component of viral defense system
VSANVVERDYVLAHVIASLALLGAPDGLIFKGGTALRLCYFDEFRYSADLDFSLVALDKDDALTVLASALATCKDALDFPRLELHREPSDGVTYVGPLGRERRLKLDLAENELVVETTHASLIRRYEDHPDPSPSVCAYTLEEQGAEKLRCVIQRLQCRDPFDLHRLFVTERVSAPASFEVFERKARHLGIDPAVFDERLEARLPQYRSRWDDELEEHVGAGVPEFEATMRELRRALRQRST